MSRPAVLPVLVCVVVLAQVTVPAWALLDGKQNRWGWQMYAGREQVVAVRALDDQAQEVAPGSWVARNRPEIRWTTHAPPYLCAIAEVEQVVIEWSDGAEDVVPC